MTLMIDPSRKMALIQPGPKHRDTERWKVGVGRYVEVQVAEAHQAVEEHRGGGLRKAEPVCDFVRPRGPPNLGEELDDPERARSRLHRNGHCGGQVGDGRL